LSPDFLRPPGAEKAWDAQRRLGNADELFAPVLVDARRDGDTRTVRFGNGMVARERGAATPILDAIAVSWSIDHAGSRSRSVSARCQGPVIAMTHGMRLDVPSSERD
jgi:hypothetical protein